ncbi:MAG: flagellin, partial [Synergistaceae bacterium]|nr:flagellin [Synergistaceae bacterium]
TTALEKNRSQGFHDETHLVEWFNWERRESQYETVPGTFVVRSFKTGAEGEYRFLGNENLLQALNFATIQESKENVYNLLAQDAHDGTIVGWTRTQSGVVCDEILPGSAALKFDSGSGVQRIVYNEKSGKYDFEMVEGTYTIFAHLAARDVQLQIGANEKETLHLNIRDVSSSALGLGNLYVTDTESAKRAITQVDNAIDIVSFQRAKLGSYQNRLEHTITNLTTAATNMTATESRIRDVDMAREMMNFTKLTILIQSGIAMLTQANQLPQNVLSLIQR